MLYQVLKPFVTDAISRFFRQIHLRGTPCEEGALLIAANHVNVVLDGVLTIVHFKRQVWLLIKGAVFRGRFLKLVLHWLHMVPVYRRRDNPDDMAKNEHVFARAIECLRSKSAILIFPEGESRTEWHLAKLHTGLARIALQAQAEFGESTPVRIQPVGITYTDFFAFNSSVTVCFDDLIEVTDYLELYQSDSEEAVHKLTLHVSDRLKEVTVDFDEIQNPGLFEMINQLFQSKDYCPDDQRRLKMIGEFLPILQKNQPERIKDFQERLRLHFQLSESLKVDGSERLETRQNRIFMFCISPFILFGIVVLFVPYRLSWWVSRRLSKKFSQYSSYAFSVGFFLFPLWYLFLAGAAAVAFCSIGIGAAFLFILVGAGYFTSKYFNRFAIYVFAMMWPGRKTPVDVLREMRDQLFDQLQGMLKKERPLD